MAPPRLRAGAALLVGALAALLFLSELRGLGRGSRAPDLPGRLSQPSRAGGAPAAAAGAAAAGGAAPTRSGGGPPASGPALGPAAEAGPPPLAPAPPVLHEAPAATAPVQPPARAAPAPPGTLAAAPGPGAPAARAPQPWPYGTASGTALAGEPSAGECLRDRGPRPADIRRGEELVDHIITLEELVPLLNRTKTWPTASGSKGVWLSEKRGVLSHYSPRRECAREVPRLMHFVWLGKPLKDKYAANINAFVSKNPEWQAHLWIETPLRETTAAVLASPSQGRPCIVKSYAEVPEMRLLGLIQTAPSIGAAADLLRLEVVYRYGGIYMDVDSHPVHGFEEYGSLFRWPFVTYAGSGGGLCNCLFSDSPGSAFLNFTIAAAYEIGTTFKIRGPLTATGPPLVNSAFVMYNNPEYVLIESDFVLKHRKKDKEIMYQSFDFSWAGVPGGGGHHQAQKKKQTNQSMTATNQTTRP